MFGKRVLKLGLEPLLVVLEGKRPPGGLERTEHEAKDWTIAGKSARDVAFEILKERIELCLGSCVAWIRKDCRGIPRIEARADASERPAAARPRLHPGPPPRLLPRRPLPRTTV